MWIESCFCQLRRINAEAIVIFCCSVQIIPIPFLQATQNTTSRIPAEAWHVTAANICSQKN